jgi:flavin-dependent dehydrogenase
MRGWVAKMSGRASRCAHPLEKSAPGFVDPSIPCLAGELCASLSFPGYGELAELEQKVGAPSAAVYRADLQALLVRGVGEGTLRLGAEVNGFQQDESGVRVSLAGGSEERADILVGADGLRSKIRATLFGPEKPRYAGYTAWRAVVEPRQRSFCFGAGGSSRGGGVPGSGVPT